MEKKKKKKCVLNLGNDLVAVKNGQPGGPGGFKEVLGMRRRWKSQKNLYAAVKSMCHQYLLQEKKKKTAVS